jgi:hypothetical protein
MLTSLALSLALTLAIELPLAFLLGVRKGLDLLCVFLVNVVTNPALVLILNLVSMKGIPPWYLIAVLELGAVAIESLFYHKCLSRCPLHPLLLSLILNGISYLGGYLL